MDQRMRSTVQVIGEEEAAAHRAKVNAYWRTPKGRVSLRRRDLNKKRRYLAAGLPLPRPKPRPPTDLVIQRPTPWPR